MLSVLFYTVGQKMHHFISVITLFKAFYSKIIIGTYIGLLQ